VIFGVKSDKGIVRDINEDSFNIIEAGEGIPASFIIADGMGGHNSGEVASRMAVETVSGLICSKRINLDSEDNVKQAIISMMKEANTVVYTNAKRHSDNHDMGTTLTVAVVYKDKLIIGHVGDSRAYVVRGSQIERITTDHSYVEELVKNGLLTREQAQNHPRKNVITRSLGAEEDIQVDIYTCDIIENDIFLLCTDGLTNMISEDDIRLIVEKNDKLSNTCDELVNLANSRGGEDNITVIVFKKE